MQKIFCFGPPKALFLIGILALAGCGGGGSSGGSPAPPVANPPSNPPVVTPTNAPPTATTGPPQSAQGGGVVVLSGSGTDPEKGALTYLWTQTSGPTVTLKNASTATATFTAPIMAGLVTLNFELTVTDPGNLSAKAVTNVIISSGFTSCTPTTPPTILALDSFYKKYCDAGGIMVLSSEKVPDRGLEWARYLVLEMSKHRPDVTQALIRGKARVSIIGITEVTTDIPEYRDLYTALPGTDWNRFRGIGGVIGRPASSVGEENLLCYSNDPYRKTESILVHEFGHAFDQMGLRVVDVTFASRLSSTYTAAMATGLWTNTYSATNKEEYWAEGVQAWFNVAAESVPANGVHGPINTRSELASYDPNLYQLLLEAFAEIDLPMCPS